MDPSRGILPSRGSDRVGASEIARTELAKMVDECHRALERLENDARNYSEEKWPRRRSNGQTLRLLSSIVQRTKACGSSLKEYKGYVDGVSGTAPEGSVRTAVDALETIRRQTIKTCESLRYRASLRRVYLVGFLFHHDRERAETIVNKLLDEIESGVENVKTLDITSDHFPRRHETPLVRDIEKELRQYVDNPERQASIKIGELECLWNHIPLNQAIQARVGDSVDPGHGLRFEADTDCQNTKLVLVEFLRQWGTLFGNESPIVGIERLPSMVKIFLILKHIGLQRCVESFLRLGKEDEDLPLETDEDIEAVLGEQPAQNKEAFQAQQYRAVRRRWDPGHPICPPPTEPLPLMEFKTFGSGAFGLVHAVQDVFTGERFAHKLQKYDEDREYFEQEIANLGKIGEHPHVVKLIKTYERRNKIGLLMSLGDGNVHGMLKRIDSGDVISQSQDRKRWCDARESFTPTLCKSFGCLSKALAHIHSRRVRHQDIKPDNIIWTHLENNPGEYNYHFIDFNVAKWFAPHLDSRTQQTSTYSKRYTAPEALHKHAKVQQHSHSESSRSKSNSSDSGIAHSDIDFGRKADVFSLGLVFLEILSVLIGEPYESRSGNVGHFQSLAPFYLHTEEIQKWITAQVDGMDLKNPFRTYLSIFSKMVIYDEKQRPNMTQIVEDLKREGERLGLLRNFFCEHCIGND